MSQLLFYPTAKHLSNHQFPSSLSNILTGGCRLSFCIVRARLWKPVFQRSSRRPSDRAKTEQYKQSFVGFSRFFTRLGSTIGQGSNLHSRFLSISFKLILSFFILTHNPPPCGSIELKYNSICVCVHTLFMGCPLSRNVSDRTHLVS